MGWDLTEWGLYLSFGVGSLKKMTIRDFCSRFEFLINKYFKTRRVFGIVCLKVVLLFVHEEEEHHWGTELP